MARWLLVLMVVAVTTSVSAYECISDAIYNGKCPMYIQKDEFIKEGELPAFADWCHGCPDWAQRSGTCSYRLMRCDEIKELGGSTTSLEKNNSEGWAGCVDENGKFVGTIIGNPRDLIDEEVKSLFPSCK